ncbi:MAG: hypothetical protein CMJ76_11345 [Planctomycetaceae bacterium]|nr:hypothetical protein [Planctomycetaceae bacterium]
MLIKNKSLAQFASLFIFIGCLIVPQIATVQADEQTIQLVKDLSSRKFSIRQNAMTGLIERGSDVVPELEAAMTNGSRELRFRAQRVLDAVEHNAYQLKLEAFMQSGEDAAVLPGWDTFKTLSGTSSTARRLFVLMCRAEPDLMRNLDREPGVISAIITTRCKELQQVFRTYKRDSIQLGTVAALLFSGGIDSIKVDDTSVKTIYSVCNYDAFRNEMYIRNSNGTSQYRRTPRSSILRQLFAIWMRHGQSWDAQMAFNLAMQYDIRQCLPRAIALVRAKNTPCHVAQIALVAVTRFGSLENIRDLEIRIDDKGFCGVQQRIGQKLHQTQLRDIAIAGALLLADQKPREFGFSRISYTNQKQISYATVGFADDMQRSITREKYDAFRSTLELPEPNAPDTPDE